MEILVTGGTGFIGSRLAERAARDGHGVVAVGAERTPVEAARRRMLEAAGVRVVVGSLADTAMLREAVRGRDAVFHLAAAQHESHLPDSHFYAVNVEGTRNLLQACVEAGSPRVVHGSTIGVYGSAHDGPLDEESETHPDNIYGITKLEAERVVRSFATQLPVTIIRISETYGPGDQRLLKLFKLIAKGTFPMIGGGRNEHQPVFVDDLIDGLWLAATAPQAQGQTFVLAGGEVVPTRRYVELIASALGTRLRSIDLPVAPFWLGALLFEKTFKPLGLAPLWHRRRLDFFIKRFHFSLAKARSLLGYEPATRFDEGTAETAQWYRAQGYL
ncbi:MAG TPA: NAD(P)-dependent oxidoreductase [Gammaproteobacteria bacterium]